MGLFTGLLTLPLTPVRGVVWVARRVEDAATAEIRNPAAIRAELAELQRALAEGEIDEETYDRREDALLERLEPATYRLGSSGPAIPARDGDEEDEEES
ncbi:gas vesicle protein GvpG [Uniformispora flossi]|uniref:gas vesicle protein GvpG n=1 Tax=Uniformispora flossi TaxID=3390723 RepID=UPI003C2F12DF